MAGVSKITLVGNLGRDPETRYTPNGRMNVRFTMAVTRRRSDGSGGFQETTNWFSVTGWGRLAETLDMNADEVQLLGMRGDASGDFGGPVGSGKSENFGSDDVSMDDVPF